MSVKVNYLNSAFLAIILGKNKQIDLTEAINILTTTSKTQ